jgi:hypothetical protein
MDNFDELLSALAATPSRLELPREKLPQQALPQEKWVSELYTRDSELDALLRAVAETEGPRRT